MLKWRSSDELLGKFFNNALPPSLPLLALFPSHTVLPPRQRVPLTLGYTGTGGACTAILVCLYTGVPVTPTLQGRFFSRVCRSRCRAAAFRGHPGAPLGGCDSDRWLRGARLHHPKGSPQLDLCRKSLRDLGKYVSENH